jgi:hypothetical protein
MVRLGALEGKLLVGWGVVFRDVYLKERLSVPWREVLWAMRRLEARDLIRGGRFVTGVTGASRARPRSVTYYRLRQEAPGWIRVHGRTPMTRSPPCARRSARLGRSTWRTRITDDLSASARQAAARSGG